MSACSTNSDVSQYFPSFEMFHLMNADVLAYISLLRNTLCCYSVTIMHDLITCYKFDSDMNLLYIYIQCTIVFYFIHII